MRLLALFASTAQRALCLFALGAAACAQTTTSAATPQPSNPASETAGCILPSTPPTTQPQPQLLLFHPSGPAPAYEVATVKPIDPTAASDRVRLPPGISLSPLSIRRYIMDAYGAIYPPQVIGGPDWLNKDAYEIDGKVPDNLQPTLQKMTHEERVDQARRMYQCLLADRFHLKAHFETRVLPVFELVPAKGGLKITAVPPPPQNQPGSPPISRPAHNEPYPGRALSRLNGNGLRVLSARAIKMQLLARILVGDLGDRPLVDHTSFTGYFDVNDLTWAPLDAASDPNAPEASSLPGALQENLGITVIPARDPIEVLVIDSIDRPTPN